MDALLRTIAKMERLSKLRDKLEQRQQSAESRSTERLKELASLSLYDFIPAVSPHLRPPWHLAPYVDTLDRTLGNAVDLVFAAPPQHGKTQCALHALLKWMASASGGRFYYITYSQDRSDSVALDFWYMAEAIGLDPKGRRDDWRSQVTGSRIMFTSVGGRLTGEPLPRDGVAILDDLLKDRSEGLSRARKNAVWGWLYGSVMTRRHPGSSLIGMATRWAADDPSGRLVDEWNFPYINIPAICEDEATDPLNRKLGEALWPDARPLAFLESLQAKDPWGFAAMYQGRPTPKGAEVFKKNPSRFIHLPTSGEFTVAYGADMAYTASTRADKSVLLEAHRFGEDVYFTRGISAQVQAPEFTDEIQSFTRVPRAPIRWYIGGGGEKGAAQFMAIKVPMLKALPATTDKLVRSAPMRVAWNGNRVHLPDERSPYYGPWVEDLLAEARDFTGVGDAHDDHIDTAAAAYDEVVEGNCDAGMGFASMSRYSQSEETQDPWERAEYR